MKLLAVLLALAARALWTTPLANGRTRIGAWYRAYLPARWAESLPMLALLTLVPALLVAAADDAIRPGWLRLLFEAAVLAFCLHDGDTQSDLGRLDEPDPLAEAAGLGPLGRLFVAAHERSFGVLVWFIVCGAGGALFYRLLAALTARAEGEESVHFHTVAAWVPLRLTALLCGLAGSSDDALTAWRQMPGDLPWALRGWRLLADVAAGALVVEDHGVALLPEDLYAAAGEAQRLLQRALLLLVALCALVSFGSWLT